VLERVYKSDVAANVIVVEVYSTEPLHSAVVSEPFQLLRSGLEKCFQYELGRYVSKSKSVTDDKRLMLSLCPSNKWPNVEIGMELPPCICNQTEFMKLLEAHLFSLCKVEQTPSKLSVTRRQSSVAVSRLNASDASFQPLDISSVSEAILEIETKPSHTRQGSDISSVAFDSQTESDVDDDRRSSPELDNEPIISCMLIHTSSDDSNKAKLPFGVDEASKGKGSTQSSSSTLKNGLVLASLIHPRPDRPTPSHDIREDTYKVKHASEVAHLTVEDCSDVLDKVLHMQVASKNDPVSAPTSRVVLNVWLLGSNAVDEPDWRTTLIRLTRLVCDTFSTISCHFRCILTFVRALIDYD
jgi:hypothetical protein